jgi:hypothetical protein
MKTDWSIGKRRVEVDVNAMFVTVKVDEVPQKDIGIPRNACFERASEDLQKRERSLRIKGPLAGLVIALFVALIGLIAESPKVIAGGAATALLVGYLVVSGLIRERIEAKARARRQDG